MLEDFHDCAAVYTGRSGKGDMVGCATVELPVGYLIFTAEVCAIELALDIVTVGRLKSFLVLSDSLCPVGFGGGMFNNPMIIGVLQKISTRQGEKCAVLLDPWPCVSKRWLLSRPDGQVGFGCGYGDWGPIYSFWGGDE